MSNSIVQYAYVSGEISSQLYSRTDLEKYDLGLALARNWFTDYRGGLSTRPGTEYKDWLQYPETDIRWFPFEFSPNVANTNKVVFGSGYIRFLQEGNYVLEAVKTVSGVTLADPAVFTSAAHGYANGDLVKLTALSGIDDLLNRTFEVTNVATNTFRLKDQFSVAVSTVGMDAFVSGSVARVYTLVSPYATADLFELNVEQIRDTLRLTHYGYKTRDLTRLASTNWTLTESIFSSQVSRPVIVGGTPSTSGSAGMVFAVTAVDHNGAESLPSASLIEQNSVNYATTAGSYNVYWNPVPGAAYYNVYRSTISSEGVSVSRAMALGFLGRAYGAQFLDTNIIPNFAILPPQHNNPFSDQSIRWIDITNGGSGYTQASVLTVTDLNGTGFIGYVVVSSAGIITGVVVLNGGSGYTNPSASVSIGTGATFTFEVSALAEAYPAVSSVFQQRQVYAGTIATPLGLWGSKPKRFNNFDISAVLVDSDSYDFEVDATKVAMIRHLVPMRGGLLIFNQIGIWQLSGGNNVAVTPTNALAEPQSYTGVSDLTPIKIETDLIYVEAKGYTVRLLGYNDLAKLYAGTDISILSAHFFGKGREIISWTFAQEPYKLLHGVRTDGKLLLGTIVKEQNVYSWTLATTQGYYKQVISLREDNRDSVYYDVERFVQGKRVRYIEVQSSREFEKIEDAWALDSALSLGTTSPAATITFAVASGDEVTVTADSSIFTLADEGKYLFGGGAKALVVEYVSGTEITVRTFRPVTEFIPETTDPAPLSEGNWTLDAAVTSASGLWHLEGKTVSILADGNVMPPRVVTNGRVTFDAPVTRAIIGLSFRPIARTLPMTVKGAVVEDKRKDIVGVATRVFESRGLWTGASLGNLYESKDRTTETYGQPIQARSELKYNAVAAEWDENGQTYFVVEDPLPVTILGHVIDVVVGDDQN